MKILALVPARAGSRRMPIKNMMPLCGEPLIYWTMQSIPYENVAACAVSTDDADIMAFVRKRYPGVDVIERPGRLCQDGTRSIDVVQHAVQFYASCGEWFDALVLLQPTSPLRTVPDVLSCFDTMAETLCDAVVSVTEAESSSMFEVGHSLRLRPVRASQSSNKIVVPNGAVFLITCAALEAEKDWWSCDLAYAYMMPRERAIDIDTSGDLEMARAMLMKREVTNA